jgi:transmembrane sensor
VADLVDFRARTSIEYEARRWLIRMDGDEPLTDTENAALREWMNRSTLHRNELARLGKFWIKANILSELVGGVEFERREHESRRGTSLQRTTLMTAGAIVASLILVCSDLQQPGRAVARTYGTAIGQQTTVPLSDGSSIQLNSDTQVHVAYTRSSRRIRLLRGEAVFSATPDPNRAFEVYAADSIVRAIGTAFVVHLDGRKVDITVEKGIVDVSDVRNIRATLDTIKPPSLAHNLGQLRAGEVTSFDSGSGRMEVRQLAGPELRRRMSWREGYLAFSGEPLSEVVAQLNRYSTATLAIEDPNLAPISIGGRFRIGDLNSVLDLLKTTFGIRARQVNDTTIRLEPEPEH